MKPMLMIVAVGAALLLSSPVAAGRFFQPAPQMQVTVTIGAVPAVQAMAAPRLRRLNLRERWQARLAAGKAIRAFRVAVAN